MSHICVIHVCDAPISGTTTSRMKQAILLLSFVTLDFQVSKVNSWWGSYVLLVWLKHKHKAIETDGIVLTLRQYFCTTFRHFYDLDLSRSSWDQDQTNIMYSWPSRKEIPLEWNGKCFGQVHDLDFESRDEGRTSVMYDMTCLLEMTAHRERWINCLTSLPSMASLFTILSEFVHLRPMRYTICLKFPFFVMATAAALCYGRYLTAQVLLNRVPEQITETNV